MQLNDIFIYALKELKGFDKKNIEEYSNTNFDELLDEIKKYYNIFVNITLK